MAKKATARPHQEKQRWSVARDCLEPLGELLRKLSRDHGSIRKDAEPWVPITLWGAYRDCKLDLALVCLEIAVSVPFADRVRKRTSTILRRWEKLHFEAARNTGVTYGDDALRIASKRECEKWRSQYADGPPWNECPPESFTSRAADLAFDMDQIGSYLLQSGAALRMRFSSKSISADEADRVAASGKGRPTDQYKRELIREALESGSDVQQKDVQTFVKRKLKSNTKVSPKMISEVKRQLNEQTPE